MTNEQLTSKINKLLEEKKSPLRITPKNIDKNLKESGLNSLDMMEIIVKIEEELNIMLPDDKLLEIKTPNDLLNLIKETLKK